MTDFEADIAARQARLAKVYGEHAEGERSHPAYRRCAHRREQAQWRCHVRCSHRQLGLGRRTA